MPHSTRLTSHEAAYVNYHITLQLKRGQITRDTLQVIMAQPPAAQRPLLMRLGLLPPLQPTTCPPSSSAIPCPTPAPSTNPPIAVSYTPTTDLSSHIGSLVTSRALTRTTANNLLALSPASQTPAFRKLTLLPNQTQQLQQPLTPASLHSTPPPSCLVQKQLLPTFNWQQQLPTPSQLYRPPPTPTLPALPEPSSIPSSQRHELAANLRGPPAPPVKNACVQHPPRAEALPNRDAMSCVDQTSTKISRPEDTAPQPSIAKCIAVFEEVWWQEPVAQFRAKFLAERGLMTPAATNHAPLTSTSATTFDHGTQVANPTSRPASPFPITSTGSSAGKRKRDPFFDDDTPSKSPKRPALPSSSLNRESLPLPATSPIAPHQNASPVHSSVGKRKRDDSEENSPELRAKPARVPRLVVVGNLPSRSVAGPRRDSGLALPLCNRAAGYTLPSSSTRGRPTPPRPSLRPSPRAPVNSIKSKKPKLAVTLTSPRKKRSKGKRQSTLSAAFTEAQRAQLESVSPEHREAVKETFRYANRSSRQSKILPLERACAWCVRGHTPCLVFTDAYVPTFGRSVTDPTANEPVYGECETCLRRKITCAFAERVVKTSLAKPKHAKGEAKGVKKNKKSMLPLRAFSVPEWQRKTLKWFTPTPATNSAAPATTANRDNLKDDEEGGLEEVPITTPAIPEYDEEDEEDDLEEVPI